MKIKNFFSTVALVLASTFAQAEIKTFEATDINFSNILFYPTLNLEGLDRIKIRIDQQINPNTPMPNYEIKKVEFNFPDANNLVASDFTQLTNFPDTYRAIITGPWVFKKIMVELTAYNFFDQSHFSYRVKVVENTSNINNIELVEGLDLFTGNAELKNITPSKVVDIVSTSYLDKPLTLRLLNQPDIDGIKIEAIWMGHGTEILTLPFHIYPEQKPVSLILETVFNDQRIKVRLDNAYNGPETPDESLKFLLEQAFGLLEQDFGPLP